MILLCLCLNTGFPGGFFFPIFFAAGSLGLAMHEIFPFIPQAVAFAAVLAAASAAAMRMPLAVIIIITSLTEIQLQPVIIVAALSALLIVNALPRAGDARKVVAEAEVKST